MTLHGKTRVKIWLVLAAVFLIGSVTGAALDGLYRTRADGAWRRGEARKQKHFEELRRELGLSEEQSAKVRSILDETRNEFRSLDGELRPRRDAIRQKARARMRETLSAEQQTRFDTMMVRRDQKKSDRHKETGR